MSVEICWPIERYGCRVEWCTHYALCHEMLDGSFIVTWLDPPHRIMAATANECEYTEPGAALAQLMHLRLQGYKVQTPQVRRLRALATR